LRKKELIVDSTKKNVELESRRDFLKMTAAASLAASVGGLFPGEVFGKASRSAGLPWYKRTYRWGQINLNEQDPVHFDMQWWRSYWKRTQIQGS
jgi:TAT (twin-arginine translocation) pathway signal sequence